ncbi:uncharacterized protein V3H82_017233 [Fundulus diaphanus]
MSQKNLNLLEDSLSMDELTPLVKRRDSGKKCQRSLSLGSVDSRARQLNQSFKTSFRDQTTAEDYLGRSDGLIISHSYIKYNKTFHKLFEEIPKEERVTYTFTCALQREVLYHGKLYVSENNMCFHSSVLLKETKVVIAISSLKEIKKHNPTLSVLSVKTSNGEKYLFASVRNYALCYELLQSLRCQAQASGSWIWSFLENVAQFLFFREHLSLRVIFHIFLILVLLLVLASGYIGLRITALEEQLSSLGALTDLTSHNTEYQET